MSTRGYRYEIAASSIASVWLVLSCAATQAQSVTTFSYNGPSISIPDSSTNGTSTFLDVSGLGIVTDMEFRFDALPGCDGTIGNPNAAITHSYVGDLVIRVTAPDGAPSVAIVNRPGPPPVGSAANNFCAVLLDDDGGYPSIGGITLGEGTYVTGNFAPQSPLVAFVGENPNGFWKINVSDNFSGDTGTLNRFSLILHTAAVPQISVDVIDDPAPNGCTPGSCSLREAIDQANSHPGMDRIVLPASTQMQLTRSGANEDNNASGDLDILDEVELVGAGPTQTVLTQTTADRLFDAFTNATWSPRQLTLRNLRLQGGHGVALGGAIRSNSNLVIENAVLTGNRADSKGGAIYQNGSTDTYLVGPKGHAEFRDVVFDNNQAFDPNGGESWGGAVYIRSSGIDLDGLPSKLIEHSTFTGNSATLGGGALALDGTAGFNQTRISISDSQFQNNQVTGSGHGGAIGTSVVGLPDYSGSYHLDVHNSMFIDNRVVGLETSSYGGAIANEGISTNIYNSLFDGNFSRRAGAVSMGAGEIIESTLCNNSAVEEGGAIAMSAAAVRRSTLCNNTVTTTDGGMIGGGAIVAYAGPVTIERSTLVGNTALRGGAIWFGSGDLTLGNNTMEAPTQPGGAHGSLLFHNGTSSTDTLRFNNNILIGRCSYVGTGIVPAVATNNIESFSNTCRLTQASVFAFGNQTSVSSDAINLGPLAGNGGPTDTRLPIEPSIAIDNGYTSACPALDQRGYFRTDAECDVGSVERGGMADALFSGDFD